MNQKGNLAVFLSVTLLLVIVGGGAYYLGTQKNYQPAASPTINNTPKPPSVNETKKDVAVRVENGDLVVTRDGTDSKITSWGYNDDPILSPDGNKIAYTSESKESLENLNKYQGYVPSSTNLWIIDVDGSNPIQVTNNANWVYRNNLLWLDNKRVLFTDGVKSAKVYSLDSKTTKTVLGPEKAEGVCVDACGGESRFFYSPDKAYLVLLGSWGFGGIYTPPNSVILNTKTLNLVEVKPELQRINFGVTFDMNSKQMSFKASELNNEEVMPVKVNLDTGQVLFQ